MTGHIICKWEKNIIHTANLKLLCHGQRVLLRYWGVSRYLKILIKKAEPVSFSSEESGNVKLDSPDELILLSNTTICTNNKTHFSVRKIIINLSTTNQIV